MITMIDEIYDRHYREGHAELNAAAARGLGRFANAIPMLSKSLSESNIRALGKPLEEPSEPLIAKRRRTSTHRLLAYTARSFHCRWSDANRGSPPPDL